jgi:2-keto-3-deoxy-L-rhamnonate aldolase RhmA
MLLIGTRAAAEDIEAVAQVGKMDCRIVASLDLSTDLGVSGSFDAPECLDALGRIEAAEPETGGIASTRAEAEALVARG